MGFYVVGLYQSFAWCATLAEARRVAEKATYAGVRGVRVVPCTWACMAKCAQ